jgi:hypothetical protein
MKIRGPLVTLGAVVAVGAGMWLVNVSQQNETQPAAAEPAAAAPTSVPAAPTTTPPAAQQFPAKADYVGTVSTNNGAITLDITVDGNKAIAYACDGNSVEVWLRGSAVDGAARLTSKDRTSMIDGRLRGSTLTGTLEIRGKTWQFNATEVRDPAGLYVDQSDAGRSSWIVGADGTVTGVQRRTDGSTGPAPALTADATRVNGDTDVV